MVYESKDKINSYKSCVYQVCSYHYLNPNYSIFYSLLIISFIDLSIGTLFILFMPNVRFNTLERVTIRDKNEYNLYIIIRKNLSSSGLSKTESLDRAKVALEKSVEKSGG